MADITDLKKVIVLTATYYGRQIDKAVVDMMADDFAGQDTAAVIAAYGNYRKNTKNRNFPLPAQILDALTPQVNDRDIGNDVAGKIWEAVAKFGQYQPDEAKACLGDLAWTVVSRMGGWVSICATNADDRGIFFAQCRDITESVQRLSLAGILGHKHALPLPPSASLPAAQKSITDCQNG